MKTNISFIVPCYNCAETVSQTLLSVIETNMEPGDEIILIDDASTDETNELLSKFAASYSFIKLLKHFRNKGTAAAGRNTGMDAATHDLFFCIDADNILKPGSIAPLKKYLLDNKLDAAAFGTIDYFSDDPSVAAFEWKLFEKLEFINALNNPMQTPCGSGNYLLTRDIWKSAGRYNECIGGAYDSEIFGLRLLGEGAKFWTLPGYSYLHRTGYESTFIKEYNKKNRSLLFLTGIMDYLHLLNPADIEYIFGKARLSWMDDIEQRPLHAKNHQPPGMARNVREHIRKRLKI
ncbi:MAG: glycosyltransferase family 2 protein [Bacteroidota bacterium]